MGWSFFEGRCQHKERLQPALQLSDYPNCKKSHPGATKKATSTEKDSPSTAKSSHSLRHSKGHTPTKTQEKKVAAPAAEQELAKANRKLRNHTSERSASGASASPAKGKKKEPPPADTEKDKPDEESSPEASGADVAAKDKSDEESEPVFTE